MSAILLIATEVFAILLLADFVSGLVHWLEDAYADESMPVIGPLVARANIVHHHFPRYFTRLTWWQSSWVLCLLSGVILAITWAAGWLGWQVGLLCLLSANANEIHKWAHRTSTENGPLITFLQRIRLIQTARHHAKHHTDPKDCHYCTTTNLLNPMLDHIGFWAGLEWLLASTVGLRRRIDTSVAGHGPGPTWLVDYAPRRATVVPISASGCRRLTHSASRRSASACPAECPTQRSSCADRRPSIPISQS